VIRCEPFKQGLESLLVNTERLESRLADDRPLDRNQEQQRLRNPDGAILPANAESRKKLQEIAAPTIAPHREPKPAESSLDLCAARELVARRA
jgi:hypothetical protein